MKQGTSVQCPKCHRVFSSSSVGDTSFFAMLDVPSQLQKVLKGCDLLDLTKPLEESSCISDMYDGELYRKFVASTADAGHRVSFTLNADGIPLFKSSSTAIWPIKLQVNEVSAAERMGKRVLAALWFGKKNRYDTVSGSIRECNE